jgi:hypothetical protein
VGSRRDGKAFNKLYIAAAAAVVVLVVVVVVVAEAAAPTKGTQVGAILRLIYVAIDFLHVSAKRMDIFREVNYKEQFIHFCTSPPLSCPRLLPKHVGGHWA